MRKTPPQAFQSPRASFLNAGLNNQILQEIQELTQNFEDEKRLRQEQNDELIKQNKLLIEMLKNN